MNLFRRHRTTGLSIADKLRNIQQQRPKNLHITIYIKDQVLFQIMPARHFEQHGLEPKDFDSLVVVHFFNKNKTSTFDKLNKFKNTDLGRQHLYFEEPKGNHNYVKEIGNDPQLIQDVVNEYLKDAYDLQTTKDLTIDYADY